jgi:hypothetical protein
MKEEFELPKNESKKQKATLSYVNKTERRSAVTEAEMDSGLVMKFSNFSEGDDLNEINRVVDLEEMIDSGKIIFGTKCGNSFVKNDNELDTKYTSELGEDILNAIDTAVFNDDIRLALKKNPKI